MELLLEAATAAAAHAAGDAGDKDEHRDTNYHCELPRLQGAVPVIAGVAFADARVACAVRIGVAVHEGATIRVVIVVTEGAGLHSCHEQRCKEEVPLGSHNDYIINILETE